MSITILDGGMGQELVRRSKDRPTALWSTQVMIDHPELVQEVHADFFAAGASIATTNTYALLRDRLAHVGLEDRQAELADVAIGAAERARDEAGGGLIAGSVGPLIQSYRPDLCPPAAEAADLYAYPVSLLKDRVDLFLLETMASVDQAQGALRATLGLGLPVWLALSVSDEDGTRLRSGERLSDLAPMLSKFRPDAILLNCSRPEAVSEGLPFIAGFGLPFGAYANGFTRISDGFRVDKPTVDALEGRVDLGPEAYADIAAGWVELGATIIGGCCEVGPAHIAELARRFGAGARSSALTGNVADPAIEHIGEI